MNNALPDTDQNLPIEECCLVAYKSSLPPMCLMRVAKIDTASSRAICEIHKLGKDGKVNQTLPIPVSSLYRPVFFSQIIQGQEFISASRWPYDLHNLEEVWRGPASPTLPPTPEPTMDDLDVKIKEAAVIASGQSTIEAAPVDIVEQERMARIVAGQNVAPR